MSRRWKLIAFFLPLAGLTMIVPPFVRVFASEEQIVGVPLVVLYMFAVWAALILIAFVTQSRMVETDDQSTAKETTSTPRNDE